MISSFSRHGTKLRSSLYSQIRSIGRHGIPVGNARILAISQCRFEATPIITYQPDFLLRRISRGTRGEVTPSVLPWFLARRNEAFALIYIRLYLDYIRIIYTKYLNVHTARMHRFQKYTINALHVFWRNILWKIV